MPRTKLTDRYLKSLKPTPDGRPYEEMDSVVSQMGVRVMGTATAPVLTFILIARYPPSKHPTRRALGAYIATDNALEREMTTKELLAAKVLTLAEARRKAQAWLDLIGRGIDPAIEEERQRHAELQRQENTFSTVAEAFFAEKLPGERRGWEVKRDIRNVFLPVWGARPITDITDLDVLTLIRAKKRTAPAQARNLLGYAKRVFEWAIDQRVYGLKTSPCAGLKATKIIGEKRGGDRILSDDELFALWRTAKRMGYPYGPAYRILVLTALRLNEVADASWSEFDIKDRSWVIPAARMKGKESKAQPHAVPLTDDLLAILQSLPRLKRGDYLFSTTFGATPVWLASGVKRRIDAAMLRTLKALARKRGEDPAKATLPRWTNHDIRRTVRSHLSRLKIAEEAREAVLAHARPGIKGVYDHHDYFNEKLEALTLWAARLRSIVDPPEADSNVVRLRANA
jgi:integrase